MVEQRNWEFEVFFDGSCPLCNREMDMIRRKDQDVKLLLTDIADDSFVPPDGFTIEILMKQIHGRLANGEMVTGVDVFRQIYDRLGFRKSVGLSRLPVIRQVMTAGYRVFAYFRYRQAVKRLPHLFSTGSNCDAAKCATNARSN